jgi:hypothetical protein
MTKSIKIKYGRQNTQWINCKMRLQTKKTSFYSLKLRSKSALTSRFLPLATNLRPGVTLERPLLSGILLTDWWLLSSRLLIRYQCRSLSVLSAGTDKTQSKLRLRKVVGVGTKVLPPQWRGRGCDFTKQKTEPIFGSFPKCVDQCMLSRWQHCKV